MTPDFKAYLQGYNAAAVRLTCILCAVLMPAGITLDLFTNRQYVWEFLALRMAACASWARAWCTCGAAGRRSGSA